MGTGSICALDERIADDYLADIGADVGDEEKRDYECGMGVRAFETPDDFRTDARCCSGSDVQTTLDDF